jgi:hypothetical protein
MVEIASNTQRFGTPQAFVRRGPVRWVLIRDPRGDFKLQALLCTDLEAYPQKILFLVCDAHWQLGK